MCFTRVKISINGWLAVALLGPGVSSFALRTPAVAFGQSQAAVQADERRQERGAAGEGRPGEGRREAKKAPDAQGTISAFSDDGKTFSVESGGRGGDLKRTTVKLSDKTKIEFVGVMKDRAKKLKVGDLASVWLDPGSPDTAAAVQAQRAPGYAGKVTALSADGKVLTLKLQSRERRGEPAPVEVKLTDKTEIELVGVLKTLGGKFKVGDVATVWLQEDSKDTAAVVHAQREPDVAGKITAVSADGHMVTLKVPSHNRGEEPTTIEIKLTDKTKRDSGRAGDRRTASAAGNEGKPRVDYMASVWLVEGSKDTAAALDVYRPRPDAGGTITAISGDAKVLTLEGRGRGGETSKTQINLTDKTKTEFVGGEAKDKKLKVGHAVTVWFQEGSKDTAAAVEANLARPSPNLRGTISAISADGKMVTVEVGGRGVEPTKVEIKLTDKTEIEFAAIEKAEEKKLTVGYTASVWLQQGSKDTAAVLQAAKPAERNRR